MGFVSRLLVFAKFWSASAASVFNVCIGKGFLKVAGYLFSEWKIERSKLIGVVFGVSSLGGAGYVLKDLSKKRVDRLDRLCSVSLGRIEQFLSLQVWIWKRASLVVWKERSWREEGLEIL